MRLRDVILSMSCALLVGCAAAPPMPPQASFTQQILDPLSSQIADQKIDQRKAKLAKGRLNPTLMSPLCSLFAPMLGFPLAACSPALVALLNSSIEQDLATLESRRPALKQELLARYQQGAKRIENGFAVCVEGQERRYVTEEGSFTRSLTDGPGPCDQPPLKSFQLP